MADEPQSIDDAMAAVAREISVKGVGKSSLNKEQNFRYRGIDEVLNVVGPIMARNGITMDVEILSRDVGESRVTKTGGTLKFVVLNCVFRFRWRGQERKTQMFGEAMDTADKATNKAMAIATKYALVTAFAIPVIGADDPDAYADPENGAAQTTPAGVMPDNIIQPVLDDIAAASTDQVLTAAVKAGYAEAEKFSDSAAHDRIRAAGLARLADIRAGNGQKGGYA